MLLGFVDFSLITYRSSINPESKFVISQSRFSLYKSLLQNSLNRKFKLFTAKAQLIKSFITLMFIRDAIKNRIVRRFR